MLNLLGEQELTPTQGKIQRALEVPRPTHILYLPPLSHTPPPALPPLPPARNPDCNHARVHARTVSARGGAIEMGRGDLRWDPKSASASPHLPARRRHWPTGSE